MRFHKHISLIASCALLASCTMMQDDKVDYRSAQRGNALEVPPDLSQLQNDPRYVAPSGTVSANAYSATQALQSREAGGQTAMPSVQDVHIERRGNQRWLVVQRPADKLWEPVREFWIENGFLLTIDQPKLGIMETDWAENRAKLSQDWVRAALGKVLDSLYETGERDKFRTRLERSSSSPDTTEIYISHRGMVEVYSNTAKDQTVWQPRPTDPELEAEFLRRLMIALGVNAEQSAAMIASSNNAPAIMASLTTVNGSPAVTMQDDFERGWRRLGLALDRTGFTVEDRDRSQGTYYVRYVPPDADNSEPSLLGRLIGRSKTVVPPARYRVVLKQDGMSQSTVVIQNETGGPAPEADAKHIATVLVDELK